MFADDGVASQALSAPSSRPVSGISSASRERVLLVLKSIMALVLSPRLLRLLLPSRLSKTVEVILHPICRLRATD